MEIGQQVKSSSQRPCLPDQTLGQVGTIKGFKMLDGSNVGIVVQFEDKFATWFFEDELKSVS